MRTALGLTSWALLIILSTVSERLGWSVGILEPEHLFRTLSGVMLLWGFYLIDFRGVK